MEFTSIQLLAPPISRRYTQSTLGSSLTFAMDKAGKEGRRDAWRLRLAPDIADKCRFRGGDRVDFSFNAEARRGRLVLSEKGFVLCVPNKSKASLAGRPTCLVVKASWHNGMPWVPQSAACTDLVASHGALLFTFPDCAKFGARPAPLFGLAVGSD